jgi:SAM-dependent methyltransferase
MSNIQEENVEPLSAAPESGVSENSSREVLAALDSPELAALNARYSYPLRGVAGPQPSRGVGTRIVNKIRTAIRNFLFSDYLAAELEFQQQLVRHLNAIQDRLHVALLRLEDSRDGTAFALEQRISRSLEDALRSGNETLGAIQAGSARQQSRLETLDSVVRGLENIISGLAPNATENGSEPGSPRDYTYLLLENRYRGSEDRIAEKLSIYPPLFKDASLPVFEIGAGRGELQRLFAAAGIHSYGMDQDAAMVERCERDGLDVRLGDALEYLRRIEPQSLGGIIAVQVIEHLPYPLLKDLLESSRRALVPAAKLVFETIHSGSIVALTQNYFRDPTHAAPLHPETMSFLLETSGFRVCEVRKLSPFPDGALLGEIPQADYMTPRWNETLEVINRNIRQLNDLLYGYQDYCVIAERRVTEHRA